MKKTLQTTLLASTAFALALSFAMPQAYAADEMSLEKLQQQISALQKQIDSLKAAQVKTAAEAKEATTEAHAAQAQAQAATATASATATAAPSSGSTSVGEKLQSTIQQNTGMKVSLGGFFDATAIVRTKNEGLDAASNWNSYIPYNNSPNAHQMEYRGSARNTRINVAATGSPDADTTLGGFFEIDFSGTGVNSSPVETNNFVPRLRQAWAQYDSINNGFHILAGQAWSLATQNSEGIMPRKELMPIGLDSGYVPGFVYTRTPQFRITKEFDDKKLWAALSIESPSTIYPVSSVATTYGANASSSSNISGSTVTSNDLAPDVIAKMAYDSGYGHYEIFGIGRTFHDRYNGANNTAFAASGGVSGFWKIIPGKLEVSANALAGQAIGRYAQAQLPDVVFTPSGNIKPTVGFASMLGITGHPTPTWDLFGYAGFEQIGRQSYDGQGATTATGVGYGNYSLDTSTCYSKTESTTACNAQTHRVWQIAGGFWKSIYSGNYGKVQLGLQDSITRKDAFSGLNGYQPHAYENVSLASFRFTPAF